MFVYWPRTTATCNIALFGAKDLTDQSAPKFEAYPSATHPLTGPVKLDLRSNPIAKRYRTLITQEMRHGANFAGYYRVVIWGCGSSCAQFAVVNLKTGRAITASDVNSVSDVHFAADDFLPKTDSDSWGFRFMKNSRLLVLIGALNEDDSKAGAFYYVLKMMRSFHWSIKLLQLGIHAMPIRPWPRAKRHTPHKFCPPYFFRIAATDFTINVSNAFWSTSASFLI
jgi:hypothetical protein